MTGGRDYRHRQIVEDVLDGLVRRLLKAEPGKRVKLHCGMCRTGADAHAVAWAKFRNYAIQPYPADWDAYGKSAGPRRNRQMVLALWNLKQAGETVWFARFWGGDGTENCTGYAIRAKLPMVVVATDGSPNYFPNGWDGKAPLYDYGIHEHV